MKVVDRVISVNIILRYYHNHVAAGTMLVNCPMQLHNRRKSHMHTFAYLIQRDHLPPLLSTSTAPPRHLYLQTAAATLRAHSFTIDKCALWHIACGGAPPRIPVLATGRCWHRYCCCCTSFAFSSSSTILHAHSKTLADRPNRALRHLAPSNPNNRTRAS